MSDLPQTRGRGPSGLPRAWSTSFPAPIPTSARAWVPGLAPALLLALLLALGSAVAVPGAIGFDLGRLDDSGLYGPPDGRRALDYEFCIPQGLSYRERVAAIDPSARFFPGSRGRIGCATGEVLVLGNTHQAGFREVLRGLAGLPFVARIVEAVFE